MNTNLKSSKQLNEHQYYNSTTKPTKLNPQIYVLTKTSSFYKQDEMPMMNVKLMKSYDVRDMNHGIPTVHGDNIKEVLSNKFLRESMERKVM
jgi:hypothetical protein